MSRKVVCLLLHISHQPFSLTIDFYFIFTVRNYVPERKRIPRKNVRLLLRLGVAVAMIIVLEKIY